MRIDRITISTNSSSYVYPLPGSREEILSEILIVGNEIYSHYIALHFCKALNEDPTNKWIWYEMIECVSNQLEFWCEEAVKKFPDLFTTGEWLVASHPESWKIGDFIITRIA